MIIFKRKSDSIEYVNKKWIDDLKIIQHEIDELEKKKCNIDCPEPLDINNAQNLADKLVLVWNGRYEPRYLFEEDILSNGELSYLKNFAYYLLSLCDSGDEYKRIKQELSEKRDVEKTMKECLGIR